MNNDPSPNSVSAGKSRNEHRIMVWLRWLLAAYWIADALWTIISPYYFPHIYVDASDNVLSSAPEVCLGILILCHIRTTPVFAVGYELSLLFWDYLSEIRDPYFGSGAPHGFTRTVSAAFAGDQAASEVFHDYFQLIAAALAAVAAVVLAVMEFRSLKTAEKARGGSMMAKWLPVTLALIGNGAIVFSSIDLYFIPAGTPIRPMGWAALCFSVAAITLVAVLPLAISNIIRHGFRWLQCVAIVLALAPFPLAEIMLYGAQAVRGFVIED